MEMEEEVIEEILRLEEEMGASGQFGAAAYERISVSEPNISAPGSSLDLSQHSGRTAGSCPLDLLQEESEAPLADPQMEAYVNYKRRKASHNLFERRRRSLISHKIRELASLLPRSNEPYSEVVQEGYNTGQILRSSVDYMRRLKLDMEHHRRMESRRRALELENQQLWTRVRELEATLSTQGIKMADTDAHRDEQKC